MPPRKGSPVACLAMETIVVREALPGDADLLAAWLSDPRVYGGWGGQPVPRADVEARYTGMRAPDVRCFVATSAGVLCAFFQVVEEAEGWRLDLFVAPERQRQGVGKAVVRAVAVMARAEGRRHLSVDPAVGNEVAIRFWLSLGFSEEPSADGGARRLVLPVSNCRSLQ